MDGSSGVLIIENIIPKSLTLDHASKLLFWLIDKYWDFGVAHEIFHSDLHGKNVRSTMRVGKRLQRIRVAGNRLWMMLESREKKILSCDKETGDNLKAHELGFGLPEQYEKAGDFVIISEPPVDGTGRDACARHGLCSHMCTPTPSGYMRCLCPTGYKLLSDGWTCGKQLLCYCTFNFRLFEEKFTCLCRMCQW